MGNRSPNPPKHARPSPERPPVWWRVRTRARGAGVWLAIGAAVVALAAVAIANRHQGPEAEAERAEMQQVGRAGPATSASTSTSKGHPGSTTAPSVTAPAPSTTSTTAPATPASITMAFAGDLLPHEPVLASAAEAGRASGRRYDFDALLAPMKPVVAAADLAICHMETPVSPDQARLSGYPAFGAPEELVDGARATGYDGCSTASNHSLDRGRPGIAATLDRFDRDDLLHAGTARTPQEAATTTVYDVHGVQVAHLSYAYGFNGYPIPADAPWSVNQIDVGRIRADAAKARFAGADLVVVSLHWGTEYQSDPSAYQRDVADRLLSAPGIDLVIGHHAHVVQPIDQVHGTYVVWGLGNQLANQRQVPRSDGLTAIATAQRGADGRWKVSGIQAVPTYVQDGSFHVLPVVRTLSDPGTPPALRSELIASYDRTVATVMRNHTPGVTVTPRPA